MPPLQLDHLVLAVPNLKDAIAFFQKSLGIEPIEGGKHIGYGTHNAFIGLGKPENNVYLELFAIDPEDKTPREHFPLGLSRSIEHPYVVSWCIRCTAETEISDVNDKMNRLGNMYDLGEVKNMTRLSQEGKSISWKIATSREQALASNGHIPFLIQWDDFSSHPTFKIPKEYFCDYSITFFRSDYKIHEENLQSIGLQSTAPLTFNFSENPSIDLTLFTASNSITFHQKDFNPEESNYDNFSHFIKR